MSTLLIETAMAAQACVENGPKTESIYSQFPELFHPAFWELMETFAKDPKIAGELVQELDQIAMKGATICPSVAHNFGITLQIARRTIREATQSGNALSYRVRISTWLHQQFSILKRI